MKFLMYIESMMHFECTTDKGVNWTVCTERPENSWYTIMVKVQNIVMLHEMLMFKSTLIVCLT